MGIGNRIVFLPPVPSEELPEITVDADMGFILFRNTCLNHYYSLPNKLYEYMMAGVPVISSDFPELRQVISRTGCGITVDPESPESICSAVEKIVQNIEEGRKMGTSGRSAALSHYNWIPQKAKLINLYRDTE
jgi:glycosyltransferase involved in cell wall biosynthesis